MFSKYVFSIRSFRQLVNLGVLLVLTFLAIFSLAHQGLLQRIVGSQIAENTYPWENAIVGWMATAIIVVILFLGVWGIVSYFYNRGKPDKPSPELVAIQKLTASVGALVSEIKAERAERNNDGEPKP